MTTEYKKYSLYRKIVNACSGIREAVRHEKNMRSHIIVGCVVVFFAWYVSVSKTEVAILSLAIGFVIAIELLNTAVEELCDVVTLEKHPQIKKIKDISAGAVLVASFFSVVIGICIFIPIS